VSCRHWHLGLERHAATQTSPGSGRSHFGTHRANVGCSACGGIHCCRFCRGTFGRRRRSSADHVQSRPGRRTRCQVVLGTGAKLFQAMGAAKVVGLPGMIHLVPGGGRFHAHSTNWIFHRGRGFWGIFHGHCRRFRKTRPSHIRFIHLYNRLLYLQTSGRMRRYCTRKLSCDIP